MRGLTRGQLDILEILDKEPWEWLMGSSIERGLFQKQGWSYGKTKLLQAKGYVENAGGSIRITLEGRAALTRARPAASPSQTKGAEQ